MSTVAEPSPIDFLARELAETSRITRQLSEAASEAVTTLFAQLPAGSERDALARLMLALQAQDRVEQRLDRLVAYTRSLNEPHAAVARETLARALHLDELVEAFLAHMDGREGAGRGEDVELF